MSGGAKQNVNVAILAQLSTGHSVAETAAACNISEATVRRRLADTEFRAQVEQGRREAVEGAVAVLTASATAASVTLTTLLSRGTPPSVRLSAARTILELGQELRRTTDFEARLAAVEEQLAEPETTTVTSIRRNRTQSGG